MMDHEEPENRILKRRIENNDTSGYFLRGAALFDKKRDKEYYGPRRHYEPRVSIVIFYGEVGDYQIMNDRNFVNVNFVI